MSTVSDHDLLASLARLGSKRLDLLDDIHTLADLTENNMLSIKPLGLGSAEEELASIGVGASIGHGENPRPRVLQGEVLIRELVTIDGPAASSVVVGEVAALAHKSRDDPVKGGSFESESLFAGAESSEIFGSFWNDVRSQFHNDSASGLTTDRNVKKATGKGHFLSILNSKL